jgi:hypothetical protein
LKDKVIKGGNKMAAVSINYLAVVAAAVAGFLVGWGWYAVFGKVWMVSLGKTKEDCKPTPLPFIIAGVRRPRTTPSRAWAPW